MEEEDAEEEEQRQEQEGMESLEGMLPLVVSSSPCCAPVGAKGYPPEAPQGGPLPAAEGGQRRREARGICPGLGREGDGGHPLPRPSLLPPCRAWPRSPRAEDRPAHLLRASSKVGVRTVGLRRTDAAAEGRGSRFEGSRAFLGALVAVAGRSSKNWPGFLFRA